MRIGIGLLGHLCIDLQNRADSNAVSTYSSFYAHRNVVPSKSHPGTGGSLTATEGGVVRYLTPEEALGVYLEDHGT